MTEAFRTYDVYQRERVGQSTPLIKPRQLLSPEFAKDPYPTLAVLREEYPCYRDWSGNSFWITRYDDVTSVFVDDANYETRPRRWTIGLDGWGRDLRDEMPVLVAEANRIDQLAPVVAARIIDDVLAASRAGSSSPPPDLALDVAARFPVELVAAVLGIPDDDVA